MRRYVSALSLSLLAAACGPLDENGDGIGDGIRDPDSVSLVAPSTPVGTVSGQVFDTRLQPLADVTASINVGGATGADGARWTVNTNAEGEFAFQKVPAGSQVLVTVSKQGFATARMRVTVPASAGNFPINNANAIVGPLALTELDGTLQFLVVTESGRPAKGVQAVIEATPAAVEVTNFGTYGNVVGVIVVEATADDSGILTVTGIPSMTELARLGGRINVSVAPYDENGDGIYESAGAYRTWTANQLMLDPSPRLIDLPDARDPGSFGLLASNVPSLGAGSGDPLENMIRPGEAIYLVFNQAVQPGSVQVRLTDEYAKENLSVSATIGPTGNVVLVQPSASLSAGREYNITFGATSADSGQFDSGLGYFFVGDPAAPMPVALQGIQFDDANANSQLNPGEIVYVHLTVPIGVSTAFAPPLFAYFNMDLDGSGTIGDVPGETGNDSGFTIYSDEPDGSDGLFSVRTSGYTTRCSFQYPAIGYTANIAPQTTARIAFSMAVAPTTPYETIWGQPVTQDLSAGITVQP